MSQSKHWLGKSQWWSGLEKTFYEDTKQWHPKNRQWAMWIPKDQIVMHHIYECKEILGLGLIEFYIGM